MNYGQTCVSCEMVKFSALADNEDIVLSISLLLFCFSCFFLYSYCWMLLLLLVVVFHCDISNNTRVLQFYAIDYLATY